MWKIGIVSGKIWSVMARFRYLSGFKNLYGNMDEIFQDFILVFIRQ